MAEYLLEVVNDFISFFLDTQLLLYQIVFISIHFYTSDSLPYISAGE